MPDGFEVGVELHQGSALDPSLFAVVMDGLIEEVRQESPWAMVFVGDVWERWRYALEKRNETE